MNRPKSIQELSKLADTRTLLQENPNYQVKMWIRSASLMLQQGQESQLKGDLEDAYVKLLKGVSIVLELIPQHKLYNPVDPQYKIAKLEAVGIMDKIETIKQELVKRQKDYKEPVVVAKLESIECPQLFETLVKPSLNVVVFDIRASEHYVQGHLKWKANLGTLCGVVNIEPDWLNPGTTAKDIENYLINFGASMSRQKLFRKRDQMDHVFIMDHNSTSHPKFDIFFQAVQPLKIKIIKGGFHQWEQYVKEKFGIRMYEWIEIGEGSATPTPQSPSLRQVVTSPSEYVQRPSVPKRTTSIDKIVNIDTKKIPRKKSLKEVYSPLSSQFDDPFMRFQHPQQQQTPQNVVQRLDQEKYEQFQAEQRLEQQRLDQQRFEQLKAEQRLEQQRLEQKAEQRLQHLVQQSTGDIVQFHEKFPELPETQISYPSLQPKPSIDDISNFNTKFPDLETLSIKPPVPEKPRLQPPLIMNNKPSYNQPTKLVNTVPLQRQDLPKPLPVPKQPYLPPPDLQHNLVQPQPMRVVLPNDRAPALPPKTIRRASSPSNSAVTARFYPSYQEPTKVPMSAPSIGMAGLKNLGNTCFMNSTLQCLSATVPLARYFLDGSYRRHLSRQNPLGSQGKIAESYASLIRSMWSENEQVVIPSSFKQVVGEFHPSFAGNEQQDSQEFLAFLLDALHEDMNLSRRTNRQFPKEQELDSESIPEDILMKKELEQYRMRNWSIIVDMFQGSLKSVLKCLTCGKTSTTFNMFMYLTLPIPSTNKSGMKNGPVYIDECLNKYFEEEILDGDDQWHCPRCKTPRRATKRLTIARLPLVLLIHLKRFSFDGPFRDKVETYVEFPINSLNMTPYIPQRKEFYRYDLYAISNHFGGLNGGHYTAQVKNNYKNQWYNFDDSRISSTDENTIKSSAAYILYYVRTGNEASQQMANWWNNPTDPVPKF